MGIESLGQDSDWESPAALMDPTKSIGLSPAAVELRIETEELISELSVRRPELVSRSDKGRCLEAVQNAVVARQLLTYHAGLARLIPTHGVRGCQPQRSLPFRLARAARGTRPASR